MVVGFLVGPAIAHVWTGHSDDALWGLATRGLAAVGTYALLTLEAPDNVIDRAFQLGGIVAVGGGVIGLLWVQDMVSLRRRLEADTRSRARTASLGVTPTGLALRVRL